MTWLNDRTVQKWFELIKNERTITNYQREFPLFLEFVQQNSEYKTPSQIIETRIRHLRSSDMNTKRIWEDFVIKYMHSLEDKGLRKSTITTYLRTVLSFFSHNHVRLTYARKELLGAIEPSEADKVIKEWIPTNEEIRLLYRMAKDARDRAILLTLYQSGFSEVDVCSLNVEHLDLYENGNWKPKEHQYIGKLRKRTFYSKLV